MTKEIYLNSVEQYNKLYGLETLHPLVSVIDLNKATKAVDFTRWHYGMYALYLKMEKQCAIQYGRTTYDYQEGTVVCFAPGQSADVVLFNDKIQQNVLGILFHPDLLNGTSLGKAIGKYTFFSYEVNEALHLSADERDVIMECFKIIRMELQHSIDKHSKTLLVNHIELLLNYCMRFYERQFVTREELNNDVLARFEQLLNEYWDSGEAKIYGRPTVKYFADKVCLSPNYFGDLIKAATGKSAQERIQSKIIEMSKEAILNPRLNTKQIADMLGFQYPQHFLRFFKKQVGCTPKEYKQNH